MVLEIALDNAASTIIPGPPGTNPAPSLVPMGTGVNIPPSTTSSVPVGVQSEIYCYVKGCNAEQRARIGTAWNDSKALALAHNKWIHLVWSLVSRAYIC
jgi:hypothetical protein